MYCGGVTLSSPGAHDVVGQIASRRRDFSGVRVVRSSWSDARTDAN